MKIRINWKYCALVVFDVVIAVYLVFAMTSWNKPDETPRVCTKVEINIEDENENGFLKTAEVKSLLEKKSLYPLKQRIEDINTREIENILLKTAFVKTAECYVTEEGHVNLTLTQRTPIVRVKAENGEDYYIDDNGGVMPNSQYTSDMIIVTGQLSKQYACKYISILAATIMSNDLWHNQVEQINVMKDKTIEIVPRVGDHIINIGMLPNSNNPERRKEIVTEFVNNQLNRIELFYKYGLSEAGWNKYSYISIEFANQVICTNREGQKHYVEKPITVVQPQPETATAEANSSSSENATAKDNKKEPEQAKKEEKKEQTQTKNDNKPKTEEKSKKDNTPKQAEKPKQTEKPKQVEKSKQAEKPKQVEKSKQTEKPKQAEKPKQTEKSSKDKKEVKKK